MSKAIEITIVSWKQFRTDILNSVCISHSTLRARNEVEGLK